VGPRAVDLDGVSAIDRSGERVLSMMIRDGVHISVESMQNIPLQLCRRAPNRNLNSAKPW
jgi:hypothetical protein